MIEGDAMSTGVRGPYGKTPQVRRQIIEAAFEIFSASGYRAATMKDVAMKVGMTPKGLNHHFATKEDLLGAVLELRDEVGASRHVPRSAHPSDALDMILAVLRDDAATPHLIELHISLAAEASQNSHPAHQFYADRYNSLREALCGLFAQARAAGKLRSKLEDHSLAALLIAVMDGLQLQWLYDHDAVEVEPVVRSFLEEVAPDLVRPRSLSAAQK
ncbi:TetR/AcrR family transcriptional regulator [Herbiconiux sp. A18JL235]|uniref:TetR/AcrR family transcriptional regulator n=1 Tax=Herbiconiux sp. A18JL235 TaxID=3152363 RepID=A0AB39BIW9_9MICO